jgi:hypothetical protein
MSRHDLMRDLEDLYAKHGEALDPFINFDALWEWDDYISTWRKQSQKHIAQQYLPGFQFESNENFRWHFRGRDDPRMVLRVRRDPGRAFDDWIRAIMVPKVVHYRAEIALAMQRWEARNKKLMGKYWDSSMGWINRVQHVLQIAPVVGTDGTPNDVTERTIWRWAEAAERYRQERANAEIPSRWRIASIELASDSALRWIERYDHEAVYPPVERPEHYRESWVWDDADGHPAPLTDTITFGWPADGSLWQTWRSRR